MTLTEVEQLVPAYLINSKQYPVLITDAAGSVLYLNNAYEQNYGVSAASTTGLSAIDLFIDADIDVCIAAVEKCFLNPNIPFSVLLRKFNQLENKVQWTQWEFTAIHSPVTKNVCLVCLGQEETKLAEATTAAASATQQLEQTLNQIEDGFFIVDEQWKVLLFNKVAKSLLKEDRAEIIGTNIFEIIPAEANPIVVEKLKKAAKEQKTTRFSFKSNIYPDKYFRFSIYPSEKGLAVIFRDVTKDHKQEIEIAATKDKLQAIIDSSSSTNLLLSPELKVLSYNKRAKENVKHFFNAELNINDDFKQYVLPDSAGVFYENFAKALQGEAINKEYPTQTAVGEIWYEFKYVPVYNKADSVIGVSFDALDINERKVAEEKLKQSQYLLTAIYNSTTDGCTFINKELKIVYENRVAREIIEEVFGDMKTIGENSLNLIMPEFREEFRELYTRALAGERFETEKFDGNKWWLFVIYPVRADGTEKIVGIALNVRDVTAKKKVKSTLEKQNEILKEIAWQQSHEVRGPVASIMGLCELLSAKAAKFSPDEKLYVELLLESAKKLDSIIKKIVSKTYTTFLQSEE